jgi:hypothetical protein
MGVITYSDINFVLLVRIECHLEGCKFVVVLFGELAETRKEDSL